MNCFSGRWALTLPVFIALAVPARSQTLAPPPNSSRPFLYDANKEITLQATVSKVFANPGHGMMMGAHLMLQTSSGTMDASLGRFAFRGNNALSVAAGERVEVTGVLKTINGSQVLLVRTLKVNNEIHTLRNQHGVIVSPAARQRAAQKGVAL